MMWTANVAHGEIDVGSEFGLILLNKDDVVVAGDKIAFVLPSNNRDGGTVEQINGAEMTLAMNGGQHLVATKGNDGVWTVKVYREALSG
jgi:hypothetical protein